MSKKISQMPEKLSMVDGDFFTIVDSQDGTPATQNKRVQKTNAGIQPEAPAGNQLGVNGGWTAAGNSATRNVGAGSGDVAAGNAPAASVTGHETTFAHANLPTTAQKGAMDAAASPSGGNPFATLDDIPANGSGHTIQDEGAPLPARSNLNFAGAGVTATDDAGNDATLVTIPGSVGGSKHVIQDEGISLSPRQNLNFIGNIVAATDNAGNNASDVTINGATIAQGALADTAVQPARAVNTGTGLSGGGDLSADRTIVMANTAVTPGSYTNADITVDAQGRLTAAANGSPGGVPADVHLDGYTEDGDTTLATSGTVEIPQDGRIYEIVATGDLNLVWPAALPTAPKIGSAVVFVDNTGGHTLSVEAGAYWPGGNAVLTGAFLRYVMSHTPSGKKIIDGEEMATV